VSGLTEGAFDISFASMENIWLFDGQEHDLPDSSVVQKLRSNVNWSNIVLNSEDTSVYLKEIGMRISFGAIGKGYAANKAVTLMRSMPNVNGGVVNASGDLKAWGENGRDDNWSVQIADPQNKDRAVGFLNVKDMSVVTSGNYEKYFTSNGVRYAHILNPKTGYPTTGIKSVTIVCQDAEIADALATSVFALGITDGLDLINTLDGVECILITDKDLMLTSDNLNLNYY
jgi:thiamine biosynthesis lipoprotein